MNGYKQKGIALIQVLIISTILSLLAIFITHAVRSQIHLTQHIQGYAKSAAVLETVEAELIHSLNTHKRYRQIDSENVYVSKWNFYGEEFQPKEGVSIKLQDRYGQLSVNHTNRNLSGALMRQLGHSESDIRILLDSMADWVDSDDLKHLNGAEAKFYESQNRVAPRNGYFQSLKEVSNVRKSELLTLSQWQDYFSTALISKFNPLTAHNEILRAYLNNEQIYEQVVNLRTEGQLNGLRFFQLTGIESGDYITFITGRMINVVLTVNDGDIEISKSFDLELRPNAVSRPVIISNIRWD